MAKFTLGSVLSFLGKHANDLNTMADLGEMLVAAIPVNQETRTAILNKVEAVRTSADNIIAAVQNVGGEVEEVAASVAGDTASQTAANKGANINEAATAGKPQDGDTKIGTDAPQEGVKPVEGTHTT